MAKVPHWVKARFTTHLKQVWLEPYKKAPEEPHNFLRGLKWAEWLQTRAKQLTILSYLVI